MTSLNPQPSIDEVLQEPSLYPEQPRKDISVRKAELLDWQEKYGEVNESYNMYGLDLIDGPDASEYLDGGILRKQRYEANSTYIPSGCNLAWNLTTLTRDKVQFESFAEMAAGPGRHCYTYGVITPTGYYPTQTTHDSFDELVAQLEGEPVVIKPAHSGSGVGVIMARVEEGCIVAGSSRVPAQEFLSLVMAANHPHLLQRYIVQHDFMKQANPTSVNTVRIISWHTGDSVVVNEFASLRFGKPGAMVDNANAGGSIMYIDSTGTIGPDAYNFNDKSRFEAPLANQVIPYWAEIRAFVERLHGMVPGLFTVGWDIALTNDGPFVIEGNDGWELYVTQTPPGCGQRARFNELLARRTQFFQETDATGFIDM